MDKWGVRSTENILRPGARLTNWRFGEWNMWSVGIAEDYAWM